MVHSAMLHTKSSCIPIPSLGLGLHFICVCSPTWSMSPMNGYFVKHEHPKSFMKIHIKCLSNGKSCFDIVIV